MAMEVGQSASAYEFTAGGSSFGLVAMGFSSPPPNQIGIVIYSNITGPIMY